MLGETEWEKVLKKLKDKQLWSLTTFDVGYGDGKRKLAWFWNVHSSGEKLSVAILNSTCLLSHSLSNIDQLKIALQIEVCCARARAHQWQEECILLQEEMRRVAQFWLHGHKMWNEWAQLYENLVKQCLPPSADIAAFPQLVEDEHNQRVSSFRGKIAYARRQAALREHLRDATVKAHAHLVEPLCWMDKGDGKAIDGDIMVEGKGYVPEKKKCKKGKGK